jgi:hypothetical protein
MEPINRRTPAADAAPTAVSEDLPRPVEDLTDPQAEAVQGGRKAGADQQEYMKVTMTDVLISG